MRKNLPQVIQRLIAPKPTFNLNRWSVSQMLNRRKMLKECLKMWKYSSEDQLDRDIAKAYFQLQQAIKSRDQAMVLRYLSIQLYQEYVEKPHIFELKNRISDIVIQDCTKSKKQLEQKEELQWFQLYLTIKHYNAAYHYAVQRRIFIDDLKPEISSPRKWYFIQLPLKDQQSKKKQN